MHSLESGETPRQSAFHQAQNYVHTTFLNIAKRGETSTNFTLPVPECDRTGTENKFNLIMCMTVDNNVSIQMNTF